MGKTQDKTEVTEIPIDKIRAAPWQPRELFEKEKIQALGESLKEKGIIQPIVVRKNKDGDGYQIIAGERRYRAWEYTGKKTIPAFIKDVDDFEAKELSIIENWHREDLTENEKEKYIYDLWTSGKAVKRYETVSDMSRITGISRMHLGRIIKAGEEKNAGSTLPRGKGLEKATAHDLESTRILKENPEVREDLLKFRVEQPAKITRDELAQISKVIIEAPQEKQADIVKLISEDKLDPKQVESFVKVLKESPSDVQDKLIRMEITTEDAEEVNIFKTPEQRTQVLEERKIIQSAIKDEQERHMNIRAKMADDLEQGKPPSVITKFDLSGMDEDKSAQRMLERYQDVYLKAISFRADHILHIEDPEIKKRCINSVKMTYDHCRKVLEKLGEITTIKTSELVRNER